MNITLPSDVRSSAEVQSLLSPDDSVKGVVDYRGRPVFRSRSGGWRSAFFIIGVEVAERSAYVGIGSNLITYLTGHLGQSTAAAAANVNTWSGSASLLTLLGAFIADSFLGRYRTILIASVLYVSGLGLLTMSVMLPSLSSSECQAVGKIASCSHSKLQMMLFFFALYLVAIAQGGHRPCVQAFGADQFDGEDPEECKAKSSFFNWWYFGMCGGILLSIPILTYIQENINWGLAFGIPCIFMVFAVIVFLLGTGTYRFNVIRDEKSPFVRIGLVFVRSVKDWQPFSSTVVIDEEAKGTLAHKGSHQFRFLNKALIAPDGSGSEGKGCTLAEVEEAKAVLRLVPIWTTCLIYAIVFVQFSTFFTKQGVTMDRTIGNGYVVPAASLQSFVGISVVIFIPIYDRILVPLGRALTRKSSGITMLQRIGSGMVLSVMSMVVAAIVEKKRLETAVKYGLKNDPHAILPMSIWWLAPQYILIGIADALTMVGLQEFFYDQMPKELRSVGLSLYLSIFGVGSFLSSFLISAIHEMSGGGVHDSWFADNLNHGHLDYFYWLLAGLSTVGLAAYVYCAKFYIYNKGRVV